MRTLRKKTGGEWGWNRVGHGTHILLSTMFILLSILTTLPVIFIVIVSVGIQN